MTSPRTSPKLEKKLLQKLIRMISEGWSKGEIFSPADRNDVRFLSFEDIVDVRFKGIVLTAIGKIDTEGICVIKDGSVLQIVPKGMVKIIERLEERLLELNTPKVEEREEEAVNA